MYGHREVVRRGHRIMRLPGCLIISLCALVAPGSAFADESLVPGSGNEPVPVERFAHLALNCLHQEYPNKIAHVMSGDGDVGPPRKLTPVFYGCYDWHSSVHGHWLLVRLLRLHGEGPFARQAIAALDQSFQPEKVSVEVEYALHEQRSSFERPYGIAWLLQLTTELREWDHPLAEKWFRVLEPLEHVYVDKTSTWLHKLAYPIRIGEHAQTAFAFGLFLDWARAADDGAFHELVKQRSLAFYSEDRNCPLAYEPGGQDFLSPCLAEADLMRRLLEPVAYAQWLSRFMPGIPADGGTDWLAMAEVTDRADGKLAHLDGLHISRAWALQGMATGLPVDDPRVASIQAAADIQARAGLAAVTGEHYEGGHWLGSFATYLVTGRGLVQAPGAGMVVPATQPNVPGFGDAQAALAAMHSRMAAREPSLNAVIALLPDRSEQAMRLDEEQSRGESRGRLHGFPVMIKDNIEVRGAPTTAGSLALAGNDTQRDAELVRRLRAAGLVIAAKTNLSEWANMRDESSTSGWSAVGGLTGNAWDPTRNACGSSSGSAVAVAAAYVPFAVGTETDGSIVCPAAYNGMVGIKPTVGLVSREGIVPISHSQDTAGPIAYSVKAAALLLSAMEGGSLRDPATEAASKFLGRDYLHGLDENSLNGVRIGVIRSKNFGDGSEHLFDAAVEDLRTHGAVITDMLALPGWPDEFWDDAYEVLLHELKHDLNRYLASLPGTEQSLTLSSLIEFNRANSESEMLWFGQSVFLEAQARPGLEDPAYRGALQRVQMLTRATVDGLLADHRLDLVVMPTNSVPSKIDLVLGDQRGDGSSSLAAISGYPHITVPMGRVHGLPVGISFVAGAFDEPVLIRAAYGYEQATRHARTLAGGDPWDLEQRLSE